MTPVIVISAADNVATALEALSTGTVLASVGSITVREPIPRGHKFALRSVGAGEPVHKYGQVIGRATAQIARGAHVHTHNVSSARGRGDLNGHNGNGRVAADGRIAEPPDDKGNP